MLDLLDLLDPLDLLDQLHHRYHLAELVVLECYLLRPDVEANKPLIRTQRRVELDAGDVLFFHCRTLHAAGHNQTADTKFSLVFTYRAADNLPRAGTRSASLPDIPL